MKSGTEFPFFQPGRNICHFLGWRHTYLQPVNSHSLPRLPGTHSSRNWSEVFIWLSVRCTFLRPGSLHCTASTGCCLWHTLKRAEPKQPDLPCPKIALRRTFDTLWLTSIPPYPFLPFSLNLIHWNHLVLHCIQSNLELSYPPAGTTFYLGVLSFQVSSYCP